MIPSLTNNDVACKLKLEYNKINKFDKGIEKDRVNKEVIKG
jgi:hypothetical protein